LTPAGSLRFQESGDESAAAVLAPIRNSFLADWREGLFCLAAEKIGITDSPTIAYWQVFAARFLTGLCHVPEEMASWNVQEPTSDDYRNLVVTAPPMKGGEYLSVEMLQAIWSGMENWVRESAPAAGGIGPFLQSRAPKWHQVGRVCFHLAENKGDDSLPFAFMATFTTGFGADGRLKHLPLGKALEQYAGARNRPTLIKLLSPVQQASEQCSWVKTLVDSGQIYRPMAWTAPQAYRFLRSVPELETAGLSVRMPNWWKKRPRPQVSVTIGERKRSTLGVDAMLDFNIKVALGDASLSPRELSELLSGEDGLILFKGQWVEVDRERLKEAIAHWEALRKNAGNNEISLVEGMRLLAGASADLKQEDQVEAQRTWVHVTPGENMKTILAKLREPQRLTEADEAFDLTAELRPYQRTGAAWLHFLAELGLGACLADDMGLGKTIQVLALLSALRRERNEASGNHPSLLIVPASLLGNWRNEASRFAPSLKLLFIHPAESDRRTLSDIA